MFDLTFRLHIHYHDPSFGAPKGRVHRINLSIFENIGLLVHIFASLHSSLFSTIKFVCNRGGTMNTIEQWRTIALIFVNDGQYAVIRSRELCQAPCYWCYHQQWLQDRDSMQHCTHTMKPTQ